MRVSARPPSRIPQRIINSRHGPWGGSSIFAVLDTVARYNLIASDVLAFLPAFHLLCLEGDATSQGLGRRVVRLHGNARRVEPLATLPEMPRAVFLSDLKASDMLSSPC